MNKKGVSWETWVWILLFLMIIIGTIRNSYYRKSLYDDRYPDQLQQQRNSEEGQQEEESRREYEQEQLEEEYYKQEQYKEKLKEEEEYYGKVETVRVSVVVDGDTFTLENGETVRLLGINAPEVGQKCSIDATKKLRDMILRKQVTLVREKNVNKDQYGRLLRYAFLGNKAIGQLVNLEMVSAGLAHVYMPKGDLRYSMLLKSSETKAKEEKSCLWKTTQKNYVQDQCVRITNFHFNAAGNDNYNLNDEYVTFENTCSYLVDMTGWTVKDETASHLYSLPLFTFTNGATVTLYTGTGTNTPSALYWQRTSGDYAAIWNNNGDTLFLRDTKGNLVLTQSYSGY